jgi:hypothetical protein
MQTPNPQPQKTEEVLFLRRIWLKAYNSSEPLHLDCKTVEGVYRIRFSLYNAAKGVKKNPAIDPELAKAVQECSTTVAKDKPTILTVQRKMVTQLMQDLQAQLGLDGELADAMPPETEEEASQRRFLEKMEQGAAPAKPANPYYKRGD